MQLYGGYKAKLWKISNPSYANIGGSRNRYSHIIVRRPLKKRARQQAKADIREELLDLTIG